MKPETRIKKEILILETELQERKAAEAKGWKLYLGEPIRSQIYCLERDISIMKFHLAKLQDPSTREQPKTKADLEKELKVFQDLKDNKFSVFHGVHVIHRIDELHKMINLMSMIICLVFMSLPGSGQRWQDSNIGLYPVSIQGTINPRNTAAGVMIGYLFQDPFFGIPVGLYGSASSTIKPDLRYINYNYERKLSAGGSVTLYKSLKNSFHCFLLIGAIYNMHPRLNSPMHLSPGQSDGILYHTSKIGVDLGLKIQKHHFTGAILIDAVNFKRYIQLSAGYSFFINL